MTHLTTRRRATTLGVAVLATALMLTGCGRSGGDTSSSASTGPAVNDKPATGTVQLWSEGADGDKLPTMIAEFKKANPNVDIQLTKVPQDQFASKMTAAITAGTVPDLIFSFTEDQAALLATGGFDTVPAGLVNESDFFPGIWANSVTAGKQYGVPWYTYANMLIYRSDLAQKAGITAAPATWDEQKAFAQKLKDSGVADPLVLAVNYDKYSAGQLQVMAAQNGGSFLNADKTKWTLDDPKVVQALDYWAGLIKSGLSSADGPAFLDTVPWMSSGKSATIVDGGPWFASWFDGANGQGWNDAHMTYAQNPSGPSGGKGATTGGGSWMVPTDAKNKDAAWKFVRWMSEAPQQVEWFKIFGNMPALKTAWNDPALKGKMLDQVHEALNYGVAQPNVATWNQVGQIIGQQMEKVVRGGVTAQAALDEAQKQAEAIGVAGKQ
ncbi:sugar ABC transporter substrate-binding protein [Microbacterium sp. ASV49]|uniref:Sugar ABC transporter substrate-binding protein n=1 Tax=Microbacterium candidum TaxID=3041922 RepID=A0ABT7MU48_9MICO|nr:sugar ABC transporter substrate-binding protein [Microbacterium sp. ASV49]MDL9977976.1 sugar ABC transporter substrate-binding protein [Microbacterium sp. ASV49]